MKISRPSRMSELVYRAGAGLAALGESVALLDLRRWLQRRQQKRQEQLQLDVRIMEEGTPCAGRPTSAEREALQALSEERERRHKPEMAALEAACRPKS